MVAEKAKHSGHKFTLCKQKRMLSIKEQFFISITTSGRAEGHQHF
jgi:hypothetical protein